MLEYLLDFIGKNEKRIVSNKKRLEAEESPELEQKAKEIHEVGIQIGEKLAKAEALGECVCEHGNEHGMGHTTIPWIPHLSSSIDH